MSATRVRPLRHPSFLLTLLPVALMACDSGPTDPEDETGAPALTVDASQDWSYVSLGDDAAVIAVADATTSQAWDMAFFATSVSLNGGDAGPGGVQGYCVCGNEGLTDEQVAALTDEDALAAFEAVTTADAPATEAEWIGDALDPAVAGWYSYDPQTHVVSPDPDAVWKVRTAEGEAFAKVRVTAIVGPTQAHAGEVTLEFATQGEAGGAMGPVETLSVDVSAGPAYVDLVSASESDDSDWDLMIEGYTIRVNGGVSGPGDAGALKTEEEFAAIADAGDASAGAYRADAYGGVFASDEPGAQWYRYNLEGQHQIWPTHNVYLVRRGADVYKVQLTGYYSETGADRHITIRYAPLEG